MRAGGAIGAQVHSPKDDRKEVSTLPYGSGQFAASDERALRLSTCAWRCSSWATKLPRQMLHACMSCAQHAPHTAYTLRKHHQQRAHTGSPSHVYGHTH